MTHFSKIGDEDLSESDSDEGVSMLDVLSEEARLEAQAQLVLDGSDDTNCTYSKGYVKRQALYACQTCNPPHASEVGGICLACSLHCHQGHDLVEMYTKRNFKCDCGNVRFGGNKCNLEPDKTDTNDNNNYNHNFRGRYCVCDKPYPDPDSEFQEDMLQCAICEDWFHVGHLGCSPPSGEWKWELVCGQCAEKNQFFRYYNELAVPLDENSCEGSAEEGKNRVCQTQDGDCCKVRASSDSGDTKSLFLAYGWRENLCRCPNCLSIYRKENVEFLLDPEDTVECYEEKGKEGNDNEEEQGTGEDQSQYNRALQVLSQLDRGAQVEAMEGYNEMKENLMEYLQKFVENGKVVREEDIEEFFKGLKANKRPRYNH